jgi:cytochrome c556
MSARRRAFTVVAVTLALEAGVRPVASQGVPAGSSAAAVIETRQAGFKKMGAALKALGDQVKLAAPDPAVLARAAAAIAAGAEAQREWFPTGSGPESGGETDALPGIWTDRARFDDLALKLAAESKGLVERVAGGDSAAIAAQVKAVGAACSACHKSFRAD